MAAPVISVIVPTKNRRDAVLRLLATLGRGGGTMTGRFEVVVVDDGSTDDTVRRVKSAEWPFPVSVIEGRGSGAAVARNAGARVAAGEVLLFLDDDVEPAGDLVAAHALFHASQPGVVGLGDLAPRVQGSTFFAMMLRSWWEETLDAVRRTGHRYSYRDLLSGHFSIQRALFAQAGGFDETLRCREDYELGGRLLSAGIELRFVPGAAAWHHDSTDLAKAFRRKLEEGEADVRLVQRHPTLAASLPLAIWEGRPLSQRVLGRLAWDAAGVGRAAAAALSTLLPALEYLKARWRWRWLLDALLGYWYWRGVASAIGTRADLAMLMPRAPAAAPALTVDLAAGLRSAEALLDEVRPRSIRLVLGEAEIGILPDVPGAEPLRGVHLKSQIVQRLRTEYLAALCAAGAVPDPLRPAARRAPRTPGNDGDGAVAA